MEPVKKQAKEPQTTKEIKPDFESGKGYYWMKQVREMEQFGTPVKKWPRKPRRTAAEREFFKQVDQRLSRRVHSFGATLVNGKIVREEEE